MEKQPLKHNILISYTLKHLKQKDKVKLLRELNGYSEKKQKKTYDHEGLVQKNSAQKLGSNVILVPIDNFLVFQNFFSNYHIKTEVKEVWLN